MIQKANLEKFPNCIIDGKKNTSKASFHDSANAFDHLRLERISSGETLQAVRNRSFTKQPDNKFVKLRTWYLVPYTFSVNNKNPKENSNKQENFGRSMMEPFCVNS